VDAVIDKDLASARLAEEVGVDLLLVATDVPGAALAYGTPEEEFLRRLTVEEARLWMEEGHFPTGSMGPKVEATVQFVGLGGKRAVIASICDIEKAVAGEAGTEVVRTVASARSRHRPS
jgi:carbamate kinase